MLNPVDSNRIIVLDTETTGLNPQEGHRIIEIGCVELINRRLTGNRFHVYINPDREIEQGAIEVHGITNAFLKDKQRFTDIAADFIAFIKGAELVIHNAPFDVGFINHELALLTEDYGKVNDFCSVFDTLDFARKKHPGQRNSLDALCKRYTIDNSHRELHGALLDAEILADVFLMMTGGQSSLLDESQDTARGEESNLGVIRKITDRPRLNVVYCNEDEKSEHRNYLDNMVKKFGSCLWPGAANEETRH